MEALAKGASLSPPAYLQPDFKQLAVQRTLLSLFPHKLLPLKRVKKGRSRGENPAEAMLFLDEGDCQASRAASAPASLVLNTAL